MPQTLQWRTVAEEHAETPRPIIPKRRSMFKRMASAVALSLGLSAGGLGGCSGENSTLVQQTPDVDQTGVTDANGNVTFQANGRTFILKASDSEKQQSISGLTIKLSMHNNQGVYILSDPSGRYFPKIFGVNSFATPLPESFSGDASRRNGPSNQQVANVLLDRREHACSVPGYYQMTGSDINALYADYLEFSNNSHANNTLTRNFEPVPGTIQLSDLDDHLRQAINFAIGELKGAGINVALSRLVVGLGTLFSQELQFLGEAGGFVLTMAEVCTDLEQQAWASYYRGLCYQPNDEFEIWKLRGLPDIARGLVSNPVMVVFPKRRPDSWSPPVASVNGTVRVPYLWSLIGAPGTGINLEHMGEALPLVRSPLWFQTLLGRSLMPFPDSDRGYFSFLAGACENYGTTYNVALSSIIPGYSAATRLTMQQGKRYSVDFYIDIKNLFCTYRTKYRDADRDGFGNTLDRAVSCGEVDGYIEDGLDCDDENPDINPGILGSCEADGACQVLGTIGNSQGVRPSGPDMDLHGNLLAFSAINSLEHRVITYINLQTGERGTIPFTPEQEGFTTIVDPFQSEPRVWENAIAFRGLLDESYPYPTGLFTFDTSTGRLEMLDNGVESVLGFAENQILYSKTLEGPCDPSVQTFRLAGLYCLATWDIAGGTRRLVPLSPDQQSLYLTDVSFYPPWMVASGLSKRVNRSPTNDLFIRNMGDPDWRVLLRDGDFNYGPVLQGTSLVFGKTLVGATAATDLMRMRIPDGLPFAVTDQLMDADTRYDIWGDRIAFVTPSDYSSEPVNSKVYVADSNGHLQHVLTAGAYTNVSDFGEVAIDEDRVVAVLKGDPNNLLLLCRLK